MNLQKEKQLLINRIIDDFFAKNCNAKVIRVKHNDSDITILMRIEKFMLSDLKLFARDFNNSGFVIFLGWDNIKIEIFENRLVELSFKYYEDNKV